MLVSRPLWDIQHREGATLGMLAGQETVLDYGDWLAEYTALVEGVGLVHSSLSSVVELTGEDRATFLNRLATNKVDHLPLGSGCETFLTDAKAHVLAYLWLFVRPASLALYTAAGQVEKIIAHLDRYLLGEKVELHDRSADYSVFYLGGPRSRAILDRLASASPPEEPLAGIEAELAGAPVGLRTLDTAAGRGLLLIAGAAAAATVWQALREAGARPCGQRAAEALRIESGWPAYGRDVTEENLAQEVARDRMALALNKGCYLGQETIARIESRGHVNRTLVGLRFPTAEVPRPGTELLAEGRAVGRVTSATFSPRLGAALALGYVRYGQNAPGTRLDGPLGPVHVVALPVRAG